MTTTSARKNLQATEQSSDLTARTSLMRHQFATVRVIVRKIF